MLHLFFEVIFSSLDVDTVALNVFGSNTSIHPIERIWIG